MGGVFHLMANIMGQMKEQVKNVKIILIHLVKSIIERLYISLIVLMDLRNLLNILPLQLASLKF